MYLHRWISHEIRPRSRRSRGVAFCITVVLREAKGFLASLGIRHKQKGGQTPDLHVRHLEPGFVTGAAGIAPGAQGGIGDTVNTANTQGGVVVGRTGTRGSAQEVVLEENAESVAAVSHHATAHRNFVVREQLAEVVVARPAVDIDDVIVVFVDVAVRAL